MDRIAQTRERAYQLHVAGFHCAEAVSRAVLELYGNSDSPDLTRLATAFGGGLGRTHGDLCGAVAGGVLALGGLHGRSAPGEDWSRAAGLAGELRKRFIAAFQTTNCGSLLAAFGPQENMMRCKQLSGEVAGMVAAILEEQADARG